MEDGKPDNVRDLAKAREKRTAVKTIKDLDGKGSDLVRGFATPEEGDPGEAFVIVAQADGSDLALTVEQADEMALELIRFAQMARMVKGEKL